MSKDDTKYQPIPCAIYSEYELAIMRRQTLKLVWQENEQTHIATVQPLDLQTSKHQEFLIAEDHIGQALRIRLDYIKSMRIFTDK